MASSRARPSATAARHARGPAALPTYQPPQNPLNETAQRALQILPRDHKLDTLKQRLRVANNHLTNAAADMNDRYQIRHAENEKRKRRLEKQSSQEGNEGQDAALDAVRQKTDDATDKLEESVRKIIDAGAEVEGMEKALQQLQENVANGGGRIAPTQSTLGASYNRPARRRQAIGLDDEDSESEEDDTEMAGENDSAMAVLKKKIGEQRAAYQKTSLSSRYASHNDYVGFKKIVHDAHYPEQEAPPMPHASTWFPSESPDPSNPNTRAATARDAIVDDDDDDIAVASERVSINCPLTLRPMKDPVTSQKCPHSFEKDAIMSMINVSDVIVDGTGRRGVHGGQKAMKCPVCEVLLTANDLKENPILVRKIKRIQAAQNAQNDELSDDDGGQGNTTLFGGSRRPEEVSSSPAPTRTQRLKSERRSQAPGRQSRGVSMVPNSQLNGLARRGREEPNRSQVVDLEDEEEEHDEEQDEDEDV